ncbi:hypothetical protein DB34_09780 [Acetobacter pasteurianus]|nr:hypothetical protein DB34_09780 [Acetobacter pasteurianus]
MQSPLTGQNALHRAKNHARSIRSLFGRWIVPAEQFPFFHHAAVWQMAVTDLPLVCAFGAQRAAFLDTIDCSRIWHPQRPYRTVGIFFMLFMTATQKSGNCNSKNRAGNAFFLQTFCSPSFQPHHDKLNYKHLVWRIALNMSLTRNVKTGLTAIKRL